MPPNTTHTLSSGSTLVIEPMANVRSAAMTWLVPAGFGWDEPNRDGRAEITAELLMRGAGDLDSRAQADAFDRIGASRGADPSVRFMRLSSTALGSRLPEAIKLTSDILLRPRFEEASLGPAKELAVQAIDSLADDPGRRAALAARARHNPEPYARSGMGTREGIGALTRDEVASGWARDARPGGSILSVAGDVDPPAIIAALEEALSGWSGAGEELPVKADAPRGYAHEPDDSAQVQIVLLHDAPPEPHPDAPLERVVVGVLSGGMSARLFTEVREKRGLCYAVHAGYRADRDFGTVVAEVGTAPERAQESLDVLAAELLRINEGGITADELERTRVRIKSGLVFSGESTGGRAGALANDIYKLGRARSLEEIAEVYDTITLDQVNAYLKRRTLGRVTVQSLGPKELTMPSALG
ncbi:MAG: zinc protease [Phycisphaeraceae bacterium]|nr:MAG: zinc protease [Phycisphaeraceae bacterium]